MDKIICIGKNYLDHATELGDAVPSEPIVFLKPASTLKICANRMSHTLPYWPAGSLHYEVELVFQLRSGGFRLSEAQATQAIAGAGISVGLDMTRRDLQSKLKKEGHPWTTSKVFPNSAIVGPFLSASQFGGEDVLSIPFSLHINNQLKQQGLGSQMRFSAVDFLVWVSQHFVLCPGDLLFTGTPAGVGSVNEGDDLHVQLGHHLTYNVVYGASI